MYEGSPPWHVQVDTSPADFVAKFSSLAEDMPRLQRDAYLQGNGQVPSSATMLYSSSGEFAVSMHMSNSVHTP